MRNFKSFLVFGLVFLLNRNASAQTGCIGSITGDLYLTNTTGTNYNYGGTVIASANIYSTYCITSIGANGTCTVVSVPFFGSVSGSLTTYSLPAGCSLDGDEYVFSGFSLLVFCFIGRRAKKRLPSEC
ncbi:hypothetical protein [Pedobacter yonginense]|uniref:hypothetical protein n=1 Tax=Pedobacter yonginense TaxID=651869 RepID=UPI00140335EC|nr:hypothetical protein [Pedobacter yonginense]